MSKEHFVKAIYDEGRYIIYTNGLVQRKSDGRFVKMICPTKGFNGNAQYNLYTEAYGVVAVTIKELLDYVNPKVTEKHEKFFTEDEKHYVRILTDYDMTIKEMQEEFRDRFHKYLSRKDIDSILKE